MVDDGLDEFDSQIDEMDEIAGGLDEPLDPDDGVVN